AVNGNKSAQGNRTGTCGWIPTFLRISPGKPGPRGTGPEKATSAPTPFPTIPQGTPAPPGGLDRRDVLGERGASAPCPISDRKGRGLTPPAPPSIPAHTDGRDPRRRRMPSTAPSWPRGGAGPPPPRPPAPPGAARP